MAWDWICVQDRNWMSETRQITESGNETEFHVIWMPFCKLKYEKLMKQSGIGQKIAFVSAIIFYLLGIGCVIAALYYDHQLGSNNPIVASLMASVVFFIGAGIVLHVIGKVDLPDLKIQSDKS